KAEGFTVEAREVPHKGGVTFGYRVSDGDRGVAYIPDHCPTVLGPGPEGRGEYHQPALDLASGAARPSHDASLRPEAGAAPAAGGGRGGAWGGRPPEASTVASAKPADAIVVGSGPNGLAAAVTLARAGVAVHVIEGAATPGGGCRTEELTLPGFWHDVCSAVHPLAAASPFFVRSNLQARGVTPRTPKVAFAHPLDGGRAAAVAGSVDETAGDLG